MSDKVLILASTSLSRAKIMNRAGLKFIATSSDAPEEELKEKFGNVDSLEKARDYVLMLSHAKARGARCDKENAVIIGADTIAFYKNEKLEKPKDEKDARRIFSMLSGTVHYCLTGVCIIDGDYEDNFCKISEVNMDEIPMSIQDELVRDKLTYTYAGGYCIDGNLRDRAKVLPEDFNNVMGLPIEDIINKLEKLGYNFKME